MTIKWRNNGKTALFQIDVPTDLHESWGRKQETRTLGNISEKEADRLNIILISEYKDKFDRKRREIRGETTISHDQAKLLAEIAIKRFREMRFGETDGIGEYNLTDLHGEIASYPIYAKEAEVFIGDTSNYNENDKKLIARYIIEQYELVLLREIKLATFATNPKAFQEMEIPNPINIEPPIGMERKSSKPKVNLNVSNIGNNGIILTITQACDKLKLSNWWKELPQKTKANYNPSFELLIGLLGKEREIHTISPEDMEWLRLMFDNMPMYMRRTGNITKTIEDNMTHIRKKNALAKEVISSSSKNKYRIVVIQMFAEMKKLWYINTNVALENFPAWSNSDPKIKRVQYTDEELQAIYIRISQEGKNSEMFWIPFIAMHTGARRNELCQLTPSDIIEYNGVSTIRIIEDDDDSKTTKTKSSIRMVPIHSNILNAGFLDYVSLNKNNPNGRIWRGLSHNNNGWGDSFGKRYSRMIAGLYTEEDGKEKVFHSFRHTVKAKLIGVHKEYVDAIVGWSSEERVAFEKVKVHRKEVSDGYGTDYHIRVLKEAIEHLQYDWLKL